MELVTGATNSLLPKLGALLQDEYKLQDKVRKDIVSLQNELLFMKATLHEVAEVPRDQLDELVWIWAVFIKELSYDMEDVVNSFLVRVRVRVHHAGLIRKVFNMLCLGMEHHEIAGVVKEIKSLIKEVAELRDRYRVDSINTMPATLGAVRPKRVNTFVSCLADECLVGFNYENLVGVDEDMRVLQDWMTSSNSRNEERTYSSDQAVLCIIGLGGVGKTTIALALYRNSGDQFDFRAMVTLSRSSDIETILVDILSQVKLQGQQGHHGGISYLTRELAMHLEGRSYLILVDDVWSPYMWEKIKYSLPRTNRGSRIIVTTRFQAVASACKRGKGDRVHTVGVLTDEKPRELFMAESKMGNENHNKVPPRLWEMCGGLPLAIVTMAGHAACNPNREEDEWKKVCSSLVPESSNDLAQEGFTRILSHCYNDMPGEIKTCSLYLCIFPKGRKMSRKQLTRRWLAEGFVSEKDGLSVEEVAEIYFNHLVKRTIIRAVEYSSNGKVKSYQVHDMVLEYIVSKASEENFVTVVGGPWLMAPASNKVRRLSLQGGDSKHKKVMESMNLSHVRSLTLFGSLAQLPSNSLKFGIVQVLDLEGCKDFKKQHAKEICKMLLLKYLNVRRTGIDKIPKKIGKLQHLETIDIRETNVRELPKTICHLERLVNILGGNKRTRMALKLPENLKKGTMKSLRILSGIEIVEGKGTAVAGLHHLTDLRKLAIYKLDIKNGGYLFRELLSSIEYLGGCSLHSLLIDDQSSEFLKSLSALSQPPMFLIALELSGKLIELPEWITELDALTKLTLPVTVLTTDALHRLSKLRKLFSLTFSLTSAKQDPENKTDSDRQIRVPAGGFQELKLLRFSAPFMPLLRFPANAMPKLQRLELRFSNFEGMYGIENLQDLKEVHVRVHDKAGDVTNFIVDQMATAAREDDNGPRMIVDQYHE